MTALGAARRRVGITQDELARRAGMSVSHLAAVEAGRSALPYRLALRLARVLSVSASIILGRFQFQKGDRVRVLSGQFAGSVGAVTEVTERGVTVRFHAPKVEGGPFRPDALGLLRNRPPKEEDAPAAKRRRTAPR